MKRYIRSNTYKDIPVLEITVDFYVLGIIKAAAQAGDISYLPQITDSQGNILNMEDFSEYQDFIENVENYLNGLPIKKIKFSNSAKSVSKYYQFYFLEESNQPIFEVKCIVRLSDHSHSSKKLRKGNSAKVQITKTTRNGVDSVVYQFFTTDFTSYADIEKRIKRDINNFRDEVLEDYTDFD